MEECIKCRKPFEDINFERFGTELSKRIYCNKCAEEEYKKIKSK